MFGKWIRQLLWRPFELMCRQFPLVPLRSTITQLNEAVILIRIDNAITRAITTIGGGYDYSVSYLVDDSLLVDTGFPWARRRLRKTLMELGAHRTLSTVVNTHYHEDHIGNNDLLSELCDVKIYAHPQAIAEIRHPPELPWYRHFMFGPITPSEVHVIPDRIKTNHFNFKVHHLPGHSPDHICLFEPEQGWLFSGDLYIAAEVDTQLKDVDGPAWVASLEKAIAFRPECLFDAHGVVVVGEDKVRALLSRKLDFLTKLRFRIEESAKEARSLREVTQLVFKKTSIVDSLSFNDGWLSLLTCSDFSRSNLVRSFLKYQSTLSAH